MLDQLMHMDLATWLEAIGYTGLFIIVFLETGVFFGFFLPGDSLVFTAGMLAAKGIFRIEILIPLLVITAFIGYQVGYWFGDKLGHWLMRRKDGLLFKKSYVEKSHKFYEKHGGKALIFGRLVPIVRTFVPIVAGMGEMPRRSYVIYNTIGALVWGGGVTALGYFLGNLIPNMSRYLLWVVLAIIVISLVPGVIHYIKERGASK